MFYCEVLLPVIGKWLVELSILLAGNVVRRPCPDGLGLVELLILSVFLLDGFLFLLVLVFLVGLVIRSDILNLRLVILLLLISLIIADLLAPLLLDQESDGVSDELRVLLDNLLLEELSLVFLHMKNDLGTSAHWPSSVSPDGERSSSGRLPDILLVIIVLGVDSDLVSDKVGGVEAHTKLTDHGNVGAGGESLHESLGARFGDGSKVVDHVSLGHTDTGVEDSEGLGINVRDDLDVKFLLGLELAGIGEGLIPDLVQGIGGV